MPGTETLIKLKKGKSQQDKNLVFVIMPFAQEFDDLYSFIKEAVEDLDMNCVRADKEIFAGGIMDRVKENIKRAGVIVADLTGNNVNVFYELGLSHAFMKSVIMLTQNAADLPFDLRHLRTVVYDKGDSGKFRDSLKAEIAFMKSQY